MELDTGTFLPVKQKASHNDELFMQQRLHFSETLKDLKNLRNQLYSAAEYFEETYTKEEQNYMVVETLKDYITKALVNTVDHLGFTAYKTNGFLEEQITKISQSAVKTSCIEQRLQTCQRLIDTQGLLQQSLSVKRSRHHKRYIFPDETVDYVHGTTFINQHSNCYGEAEILEHSSASPREIISHSLRNGQYGLHSAASQGNSNAFQFTKISSVGVLDKRAISPTPNRLPLLTSAPVIKRSTSPYPSSNQRFPSAPRRTVSLTIQTETERTRSIQQTCGKTKRGLKTFLSMRKSRKDIPF